MPCYLGHPAGCHGLVSTPVLVPHHDALVVLDASLVVLKRVARVRIAVGAGKVEEVAVESASTSSGRSGAAMVIARKDQGYAARRLGARAAQ